MGWTDMSTIFHQQFQFRRRISTSIRLPIYPRMSLAGPISRQQHVTDTTLYTGGAARTSTFLKSVHNSTSIPNRWAAWDADRVWLWRPANCCSRAEWVDCNDSISRRRAALHPDWLGRQSSWDWCLSAEAERRERVERRPWRLRCYDCTFASTTWLRRPRTGVARLL